MVSNRTDRRLILLSVISGQFVSACLPMLERDGTCLKRSLYILGVGQQTQFRN